MPSLSPKELPAATVEPHQFESGHSLWQDAWHRLRKNKLALAGGALLIVLGLACGLAPLFAQSYYENNLDLTYAPPSVDHWFGTDQLGRDLLSRVLYGGRISIMVGLVASFVALAIGVTYGAVAGFFGGKADMVMMRIVDILYALPFTIFVILLMVFLKDPMSAFDTWLSEHGMKQAQGVGKILLLFATIGAVEWLTMARIVRAQIMSVKKMEFIEAARSLGYTRTRIIFRHMVPSFISHIIAATTLAIPAIIISETSLSFLGLGLRPPAISWGVLLQDAQNIQALVISPWLLLPSIAVIVSVLAFNFMGDGIRDAADPYL